MKSNSGVAEKSSVLLEVFLPGTDERTIWHPRNMRINVYFEAALASCGNNYL
jgi:hypothetical protein